MRRPFSSLSIDQLEAILDKATASGDTKAIKAVVGEAGVRTTTRAGRLLVRAKSALDVKQADLFDQSPQTSRNRLTMVHKKVAAKPGNRKQSSNRQSTLSCPVARSASMLMRAQARPRHCSSLPTGLAAAASTSPLTRRLSGTPVRSFLRR